jgi:hypothetical protein
MAYRLKLYFFFTVEFFLLLGEVLISRSSRCMKVGCGALCGTIICGSTAMSASFTAPSADVLN